jgi:hypothetical protein
MRRLMAAKELAVSQPHDPNVSEVTAEDSAIQAAKADRAIRELNYGDQVPQAQIADALQVPPTHLSPQAKADLIRQLRDAKALDDRNEQEFLKDYFSDRTVNTDKFDAQKELVDQVIKALQIGEDVHWATIQTALKVPTSAN